MTPYDRMMREVRHARKLLARAERAVAAQPEAPMVDYNDLSTALATTIYAWYRAQGYPGHPNYVGAYGVFADEAPDELHAMVRRASDKVFRARWFSTLTPSEATTAVRTAVNAITEVASQATQNAQ